MHNFNLEVKDAVSKAGFLEVLSPYDRSLVGKVALADQATLEQALQNAEKHFYTDWRDCPAWKRAEILIKVSNLILEHQEQLALTIAKEGGKPLKDARIEVKRAANTTKCCAEEALQLSGEQLNMQRAPGTDNHLAFSMRLPVGVVLAISAFNHPLNLACHQICCALAAGNTVIFKPASQTPLSGLTLANFFKQAGLPAGVLNLVVCSGAQAEYLVSDARVRYISFIGSEAVGWQIPKKIASGVRYSLEHGGTASAIVMADADLKQVLPSLLRGAFYHSGQVCVSTQIAYVHQSLYEEVLNSLSQAASKLNVADPTLENTDLGPIISEAELQRIAATVDQALASGAKLICGGKVLAHQSYAPTILANTTPQMDVQKHEVFGPVLCIEPFDDLNALIPILNSSRYSFQHAIYTHNINHALGSARKIDCKAFIINDSTAFRVDWMPFGGSKSSGLGTAGVRYAMLDMSQERLIVTRLNS